MSPDEEKPLARIRLHPAIIVLGGFYTALVGRRAWIMDLSPAQRTGFRTVGLGLSALGLVALVLAYRAMARAKTTINPRQHTRALVTWGVYRLSRNPIYLGWFSVTFGLGLATRSLFTMAIAAVMLGLLHWAVVLEEEAYLENTFGDEYVTYRETVGRWL